LDAPSLEDVLALAADDGVVVGMRIGGRPEEVAVIESWLFEEAL